MGGSLVALLLFLGFWLNGSYQDVKETMQKEGNFLYRESVQTVQDSMFKDFIEVFVEQAQSGNAFYLDSVPQDSLTIDLSLNRFKRTHTTSVAEWSTHDKTKGASRLTIRIDSVAEAHDTAIYIERLERIDAAVDVDKDPEVTAVLLRHFENRLAQTELPQTYELQPLKPAQDSIEWEFFPHSFAPYQQEEVIFTQAMPYLLSKIFPQILFSSFLFLLTTLAFWTLYRSNRRALEYTQLKSDFISNMTHELKTPITTVGVAVEAVKGFVGQRDWDKMKEYLDISQHELGRLSLLVDKVLKLSVFEQDVPRLNREHFDLQLMAQRVLDAMKIQLEQDGGQVHFTTHGTDFGLEGDAVHLTNVLFNLLENSLKYTDQPPVIHLDLYADETALRMRIQDNGIGIPVSYRERVFDRFFRVPQGDRHTVKGYGLGLSYVADIVKRHGGTIELSSEVNEGSSFHIKLPRHHG